MELDICINNTPHKDFLKYPWRKSNKYFMEEKGLGIGQHGQSHQDPYLQDWVKEFCD